MKGRWRQEAITTGWRSELRDDGLITLVELSLLVRNRKRDSEEILRDDGNSAYRRCSDVFSSELDL